MSRLLAAALKYASLGWPVLPLEPRAKNPLARLVPNGAINATTDTDTLRTWWKRYPDANLGIACESLLIVDVDPRNDGPSELEKVTMSHGGMPDAPRVTTGSLGVHYFFRLPRGDIKGKLAKGVDLVHGRNRYVVAAPSIHPSGRRYQWSSPRGIPLSEPPYWLVALATREPPAPLPPRTSGPDVIERARRYLAKCDPAVSGAGGHDRTFAVCCALARNFDLSQDEALALLLEDWNQRCEPPWKDYQLKHKLKGAFRGV